MFLAPASTGQAEDRGEKTKKVVGDEGLEVIVGPSAGRGMGLNDDKRRGLPSD